jgi:hypothetical protein
MIDIADLLRGLPDDQRTAAKSRLARMGANVGAFALGCAAGALLFSLFRMHCFVVPPLLAAVPLLMDATREP